MNPPPENQNWPQKVAEIHHLYCELTGQKLTLRFDRQRLWDEFLRSGFTAEDLRRVVTYLQKEIRKERRNIGALKLSNLLQLDRFEEDLHISRVRLNLPPRPARTSCRPQPASPPAIDPSQRAQLCAKLRRFREQLARRSPSP
jgi:hypothetical protein